MGRLLSGFALRFSLLDISVFFAWKYGLLLENQDRRYLPRAVNNEVTLYSLNLTSTSQQSIYSPWTKLAIHPHIPRQLAK